MISVIYYIIIFAIVFMLQDIWEKIKTTLVL